MAKETTGTKQDKAPLTCLSCEYWDRDGCLQGQPGFPGVGATCKMFVYEPGVDEIELC